MIPEHYTTQRYSRQMRFSRIGEAGQARIAAGRVAVVGIGALGSVSANVLARAGVGYLRLIDRDIVDLSNLQRQVLFTEADAREARPKAAAAAELLRTVNSTITIEAVVREVAPHCIEELIRDVDVVVDGSDNFEVRYLINDACVKHRVPWVYGGALGAAGMTTTIIPGQTACLECLMGPMPPPGSVETCATAGVLAMTTGVIANTQAAEALKILLGAPVREEVLMVDLWNGSADTPTLRRNPECPVCGKGSFQHLDAPRQTRVRALCGQDTIQVSPPPGAALDLPRIGRRLRESGTVRDADQVLRFRTATLEMTIFNDGRALIRGARDETEALNLYAEYVGL